MMRKPSTSPMWKDSYQDISLLAAVNEAQKLNVKDRNALSLSR